jgi:Family of unknown function (DUF695)
MGTFNVLQATRDGLPALLIIDTGLNPDIEQQKFPWLITISVPIAIPDSKGLCDQSESERLNGVEDTLLSGLSEDDYRYIGHITWNGIRDVLIYVENSETAVERLNKQLESVNDPTTKVKVTTTHDPEWKQYRRFPIVHG